ncbi:hypothetical protein MNB_SM-3-4 [hydrothermal vent metagenome]|uniref:Peptidase C-terminal archaeal/bacterial domain-containing protein n=1 Tax=hydrothermal vent metagenome TaxID=652676 RepID=A0A1W1D4C7_9ZZZZ
MNKIKKFITFCFLALLTTSIFADQGVLKNITKDTTFANITTPTTDIFLKGNLYSVADTSYKSYDTNGTLLVDVDMNETLYGIVSDGEYVYIATQSGFIVALDDGSNIIKIRDNAYNVIALSDDKNYLYLGSKYSFAIFDIRDKTAISKVAEFDMEDVFAIVSNGDYIYVSDTNGLNVVDFSKKEIPEMASKIDGTFYSLSLENDTLYTLDTNGLTIFDVTNKAVPIQKGNGIAIPNITSDAKIYAESSLVYLSNGGFLSVYDTTDKLAIYEITNLGVIPSQKSIVYDEVIYTASTNGIAKYLAPSDFKDTLDEPDNSDFFKEDIIKGITGVLSSGIFDVDILKITIPSGRFVATLSGMSDLNVTMFDATKTEVFHQVTDDTTKELKIDVELVSGSYYLMIASNNNRGGEYKLQADFLNDDWPDVKTSAPLLNFGDTIDGNILGISDNDYFRVDLFSSGNLIVKTDNGDVVSFEVLNGYNDDIIYGDDTDYKIGKKFYIPKGGIYFLRAVVANGDVVNKDYTFRVDFQKDKYSKIGDDADLSFKMIQRDINNSSAFDGVKVQGDYVYLIANNIISKRKKDDLNTILYSYDNKEIIQDISIIGDYVYMVSNTKVTILNRALNKIGEYNNGSGYQKVKVNGDTLYVLTQNSIILFDITTRNNITLLTSQNIGTTLYDFDIKGMIDKDAKTKPNDKMDTYIYVATQNGLYIYSVIKNPTLTINQIQIYKENQTFHTITIANPYAYVMEGNTFKILYIKKPLSTPKLKGVVPNSGNVKEIVINQGYAYLVKYNEDLEVIDINNQTQPTPITLYKTYLKLQSLAVDDGIAYAIDEDKTLTLYDVSRDYADIKANAMIVAYDKNISGQISKNRVDDKDLFYINMKKNSDLSFDIESQLALRVDFFLFNDDATPLFSQDIEVGKNHFQIHLPLGEYYFRIASKVMGDFGFYQMKVKKVEDDYPDSFEDAQLISFDTDINGTLDIDDRDIFKINIEDRARVDIIAKSSLDLDMQLFYDDATTLVQTDNNNTIKTILNPGTYFLKIADTNQTGSYSFKATYTPTGQPALASGVDEILNFDAKYIVYGLRYIYVIQNDDSLSSYNHMLHKLQTSKIDDNLNIQQTTTSRVFFYDNKIFLNGGYIVVDMTSGADLPTKYINNHRSFTLSSTTLLDIKHNTVYEYADGKIFLFSYNDFFATDIKNYVSVNVGEIDDTKIKGVVSNDEFIFVAIDDTIFQFLAKTGKEVGSFEVEGEVKKLYLDDNALYFIDDSKFFKTYRDNKIVNLTTLADVPNDFYIKENQVFITMQAYGIIIYNLKTHTVKKLEHIGKNIDKPFSYDGSTLNYTAQNQLKVFFLDKAFVDGSTTSTSDVIDAKKLTEGEGCFIATAAYGSYFQKNVKILRDFRDNYLLTNSFGREFVKLYYTYSPAIAKEIAHSEIEKGLVRFALTPIVYMIKYPFVFLFFFISFFFLRKIKKQKMMFFLSVIGLSFFMSGCNTGDGLKEVKNPPIIRNFIANIDTNLSHIPGIKVGQVKIKSSGGAEILSFRLEDGRGYLDFSIDKDGVIFTTKNTQLDCKTMPYYRFDIVATNIYGDSNKAKGLIQVNCMDEPVLQDKVLYINRFGKILNENHLIFQRTSLNALNLSEIQQIAVVLMPKLPLSLNVSRAGLIDISINETTNPLPKGDFLALVQPKNKYGKVGPKSKIVLKVVDDGEYNPANLIVADENEPDTIKEITYTTFTPVNNFVYAKIDNQNDVDYFRVDLEYVSDMNITLHNYNPKQILDFSLLNEKGENILTEEFNGTKEIHLMNMPSGRYYTKFSSNKIGNYDVTLSYQDRKNLDISSLNTAKQLNATQIDGVFEPYEDSISQYGMRKLYYFSLVHNDSNVSIMLQGSLDGYIRLYKDEKLIAQTSQNQLLHMLDEGSYEIEITGQHYETKGSYVLNVYTNKEDINDDNNLTLGQTYHTSTTLLEGNSKVYKFSLGEVSKLYFEYLSNPNIDMALFNDKFEKIENIDKNGSYLLEPRAYYIGVQNKDGVPNTLSFDITLDTLDMIDVNDEQNLSKNVTYQYNQELNNSADVYKFSLATNTQMSISLDDINMNAKLYNSEYYLLDTTRNGKMISTLDAGTYYLLTDYYEDKNYSSEFVAGVIPINNMNALDYNTTYSLDGYVKSDKEVTYSFIVDETSHININTNGSDVTYQVYKGKQELGENSGGYFLDEGNYTLVIRGNGYDVYGYEDTFDYNIDVKRTMIYKINNLNPLEMNQTYHEATSQEENDAITYSFLLSQSAKLYITSSNYMELYDANFTLLTQTNNSHIFSLVKDTPYYLMTQDTYVDFDLMIQDIDAIAINNENNLSENQEYRYESNLTATQSDVYSFAIDTNSDIEIKAVGDVVDTEAKVYDEEFIQIAQDKGSGSNLNFKINLTQLSAGKYYVLVNLENEYEGNYTFVVQDGSLNINDFNPLDENTTYSKSGFLEAGEAIRYKFQINQPLFITFQSRSGMDTIGTLYDSSFNEITYDDDGGENGNFKFTRYLEDGVYYIEIKGYSDDIYGDYILDVITAQ